jgi:hypothetical protein
LGSKWFTGLNGSGLLDDKMSKKCGRSGYIIWGKMVTGLVNLIFFLKVQMKIMQ